MTVGSMQAAPPAPPAAPAPPAPQHQHQGQRQQPPQRPVAPPAPPEHQPSARQHSPSVQHRLQQQQRMLQEQLRSRQRIREHQQQPAVPRWAPNLSDTLRKSAFLPYRPPHCTVLTNLQRGNTQARTPEIQEPDASFHNRAGRGEITRDEILLEKNIDMLDENGLTGLHWAASYGQVAATTNLLRCGASVNSVGLEGETALLLAAAGGHHDVLRILLKEGADVNHQDNGGNTALMYAAGGDYPYSCYELLLKGADLTLTNDCDQDAYGIAVTNGCKMAQLVIENFLVASLLKM